MASHQVKSYQLFVHDKQRNYNFNGLGNRHPDAQIIVNTLDAWLFRIFFLPDDESLVTHYEPAVNQANLFLHSRQYAWCVDVMRNEGPQYLAWEGNNFYLSTGTEPPGEGER
jgi:hypothetical protein